MARLKSGEIGLMLEELLKSYFWLAGYFVVRGLPYRIDTEDITDVDLWLYERPGASTRRRLIVDIKYRRSPRATERIIWTRGLQLALAVDTGIVATTDNRPSTRRLAKSLGIVLLDGHAITRLTQSGQLKESGQLQFEEMESLVKATDRERRSNEWRSTFHESRASLLTGLGVQSANKNLKANAFFAEQVTFAHPGSDQAQLGMRLVLFTSSLVAISLDFMLADQAFRSPKSVGQQ